MSGGTPKPKAIEETWTLEDGNMFRLKGTALHLRATDMSDEWKQMAVCVPEAFRLLLEKETDEASGCCLWCGHRICVDDGEAHGPGCVWWDLMVKAGLRFSR